MQPTPMRGSASGRFCPRLLGAAGMGVAVVFVTCPGRACAPGAAATTAAALRALPCGLDLFFRHYTPSGARSLKRTCAL